MKDYPRQQLEMPTSALRALATCGFLAAAVFAAAPAHAASFSGWTAEANNFGFGFPAGPGNVPSFSEAKWVTSPDMMTVRQAGNGPPTVFFNPSQTSSYGQTFGVRMTTPFHPSARDENGNPYPADMTDSGNDFIGIAIGMQSGELSSAAADHLVLDWKKTNESFNFSNAPPAATATAGIALSHVKGDLSNPTNRDILNSYWSHGASEPGPVSELARVTSGLGSMGWEYGATYDVWVEYAATGIKVWIDEVGDAFGAVLALDYTPTSGTLPDGSFALYNFSQEDVRYSLLDQAEVPEPASLAVWGLGALGLAAFRRRKINA
ncbi:MAG: PEP-CTERM sorting domain-containing protein [Planctomycetia bacterium]